MRAALARAWATWGDEPLACSSARTRSNAASGDSPDAAGADAAARVRSNISSGVSAIVNAPGLQGSRDAAVLANPPEVHGHLDDDHEGQGQHVQRVPSH